MRYFSATFRLSMVPDGMYIVKVKTIDEEAAAEFLRHEGVVNAVNPNYANSLEAISKRLSVDVRQTMGGRITLEVGDELLIAKIGNVPRGTQMFTEEEIAAATFDFRTVEFVENDLYGMSIW
jgi:hypothetical protein